MRVGYYTSTPWSRLCEQCQMWATLAVFDAMAKGPIAFSRLEKS